MAEGDKSPSQHGYFHTLPLDQLLWVVIGISMTIQLTLARILLWAGVPASLVWALGISIFIGLRLIPLNIAQKVKEKHGSPYPAHLKRNVFQRAGVLFQEYLVFISLYTFIQPLDRFVMPLLERIGQKSGVQSEKKSCPVILLHGFFCNSIFWLPTRLYLGCMGMKDIYTLSLIPALGDIRDYSKQLSQKINLVLQESGSEKVILVGHSLGGIVIRHYVQNYGHAEKVAKIVAVGSPHNGTYIVSGGGAKLLWCASLSQMTPGSLFLEELNKQEENQAVPITNIFSYDDEIVVPQESSIMKVKHAKQIPCSGVAHLAMPYSIKVNKLILKEVLQVTDGKHL